MKLRNLLITLPLLLSTVALANPATVTTTTTVTPAATAPATQTDPVAMMQAMTTQLITDLKSSQAQLKQNPAYIYTIVTQVLVPNVDATGMARSVLGVAAWKSSTPEQQQAFTNALISVIIHTYASALNAYTDQTVQYLPLRGGVDGRTRVQVNSKIIRTDGPAVNVTYSLANIQGQWKLYDMNVEGVSLLDSFRSQIQAELSQGKAVPQLTQQLEQHANANITNKTA